MKNVCGDGNYFFYIEGVNQYMGKDISVSELEKVAREISLTVLEDTVSLVHFKNDPNLAFGTLLEDKVLIFRVFITGGKFSDPVVLMSTSVSRTTGEVLGVHIHV
jgi:hypothetical protein